MIFFVCVFKKNRIFAISINAQNGVVDSLCKDGYVFVNKLNNNNKP